MAYSRLIVLILLLNFCLSHCFVIPSRGRNSVNNEVSTRQLGHHEYELAHLHQGDIKEAETHLVMGRDGKIQTAINKWPGGKVPYVIEEEGKDDTIMKNFQIAVEEYEKHTCVRFVPRTNERSYLRITFTSNGCFSELGRDVHTPPQELSIEANGCESTTTIIHELMHAIGFNHEQSRPDRDQFIIVNFENVEDGKSNQFALEPDLYIDLNSPYDIHSIMQYEENSFAKPGTKTMEAINGETLGPVGSGFAESDLYEINEFYNCNGVEGPNEEPTETNVEVEETYEEFELEVPLEWEPLE